MLLHPQLSGRRCTIEGTPFNASQKTLCYHSRMYNLTLILSYIVDGRMINSSSKMLTVNSYFALHRSQCCFCWGNLPDDLLNYIFQIHASNIIITAFRNSLLRIARRGHKHFHYKYIYKLEHYAVWDLPLVWNSLPLID